MGTNCHLSVNIKLTMTSLSPVMSLDSLVAPAEEIVIFEKFGDMKLSEDEETEDVDYSPSEAESDDSLEWASETERTMASTSLAEGKVGIDFYGAAMAIATEYVASYRPVQMGLGLISAVPILSVQRAARAAKRAGAKNIEVVSYEPCAIVSIINSVLSMLGFELAPALEDYSKPHLEPGTEPYMSEQEFGEMNLSDYDSDEDADYAPSDSEESSDDDLEYDSGASVSSASEAVESAEATELEE